LKGKEGQIPAEGSNEVSNHEMIPILLLVMMLQKQFLKSPIDSTGVDAKKAEELYTIYCAICRGSW
jgi:hypothetical protein